MRYSINIPNFGDFADADTVARVAAAAEAAGWDGLFVWDHVVHHKRDRPGASAIPGCSSLPRPSLTTRIKLGPLVTPVAPRRPQQLARQVSTLDNRAGGRVIFGAGGLVVRSRTPAELLRRSRCVLDRTAEPGSEDHAAAAQVVEGRHLAGELLWPPGDRGHQRAELDPGRREGRGSEEHPGIAEAPGRSRL